MSSTSKIVNQEHRSEDSNTKTTNTTIAKTTQAIKTTHTTKIRSSNKPISTLQQVTSIFDLPPADLSFLDVGCGMSLLPWSICEANYGRVTGIDISESAVRVLNEKYVGEKRLKFLKMDACEMTFNEKSFDVSIDKGTLDALLTGVNDDVSLEQLKQQHPEVLKILNEIYRVTSNIFFLISHSDNRSALLSEAGFVVMRKIELQNHLRKYHLYFSIKNVNEEMYKNAMKHMAEMQNDFLDNATS